MKNGEFRLLIVIFSLLIALSLLLLGFTLYNKVEIEQPLSKQLNHLNAVENVTISKEKTYKITVTLKQVDNIQVVHQDLMEIIATKLNDVDYELILIDNPNEKLTKLSNQFMPATYQALANSQFLWLDERLALIAETEGISSSLFVDNKYLYIQLLDDENYIYQIITRFIVNSNDL